MKMKKFINDPNTLTEELLEGMALAYSDIVEVKDHLVISRDLANADRVTVVSMGGTGHEPALSGYVGKGALDIAVAGDIFAAPNPRSVFEAVQLANKGHGVLLLVLNHAGDMMCADMVMKMAAKAGVEVRKVVTQEDIASEPRSNADNRRGLAGAVPMYHICGAAAREGMSLDDVTAIAQRYADSMATLSVAVRCATHPATGVGFGELGDDEMGVGMGQHGEGGGTIHPMMSAKDTIALVAKPLIDDITLVKGDKAFVMINGSGATTLMEQWILYKDCVKYLEEQGIEVVANMVGDILTVQETAGFQMNLAKWDDEFVRLWNTPAHTVAFFKD